MSVTVTAVPESISLAQVLEFVRSLGIDPNQVLRMEFVPNAVSIEVFSLNAEGHRWATDADDGSRAAVHTITLPVVSDPASPA